LMLVWQRVEVWKGCVADETVGVVVRLEVI
jgi:hypothetical protein